VLAAMQSGAAPAMDAAQLRASQIAPLIRHIRELHQRYR
jgi:hypothetical protein